MGSEKSWRPKTLSMLANPGFERRFNEVGTRRCISFFR